MHLKPKGSILFLGLRKWKIGTTTNVALVRGAAAAGGTENSGIPPRTVQGVASGASVGNLSGLCHDLSGLPLDTSHGTPIELSNGRAPIRSQHQISPRSAPVPLMSSPRRDLPEHFVGRDGGALESLGLSGSGQPSQLREVPDDSASKGERVRPFDAAGPSGVNMPAQRLGLQILIGSRRAQSQPLDPPVLNGASHFSQYRELSDYFVDRGAGAGPLDPLGLSGVGLEFAFSADGSPVVKGVDAGGPADVSRYLTSSCVPVQCRYPFSS